MFEERRKKLVRLLMERDLDAAAIVPGPNMYYFTGIKLKQSERLNIVLLTKEDELYFVCPQVELNKIQQSTEGTIFWYSDEEGAGKALSDLQSCMTPLRKIGIEFDHMKVSELKAVESLNFSLTEDISYQLNKRRVQKDKLEIDKMQRAVKIVEESLSATLPYIKSGTTELEVAARLEYEMRKRGSEGTPFGTIVASGYRAALPHGRASRKNIESGELVILDFGAVFEGYVADMTRTVAIGKIPDKLTEIYTVVKAAQQAAADTVMPGVVCHDIDETARKVIQDSGFGEFFTHRAGHGIGLSAHEEPYLMPNNRSTLQPGMTFTIEPGIYLPKFGGVRIEDNFVITENGSRNFMSFTKDLITLKG
ncbi:aminopeptidase P family protein [Sporolactobacillus sp. THM7-7]|nr:aminopeptidase P family protein [Sporolactobacillus sp. THM7-7]